MECAYIRLRVDISTCINQGARSTLLPGKNLWGDLLGEYSPTKGARLYVRATPHDALLSQLVFLRKLLLSKDGRTFLRNINDNFCIDC